MLSTHTCILLLLMISLPRVLAGQDKYYLPPKNYYEEATVGFFSGEKKDVTKLSITSDSVAYFWNGNRSSAHLEAIEFLRVDIGPYTKRAAFIGGGLGLVISGVSTWLTQNDPGVTVSTESAATIVFATAGGAAIGALIGAGIRHKISIYIHPRSHEQD